VRWDAFWWCSPVWVRMWGPLRCRRTVSRGLRRASRRGFVGVRYRLRATSAGWECLARRRTTLRCDGSVLTGGGRRVRWWWRERTQRGRRWLVRQVHAAKLYAKLVHYWVGGVVWHFHSGWRDLRKTYGRKWDEYSTILRWWWGNRLFMPV